MAFGWVIDIYKNVSAIALIIGALWGLYYYLRGRTFQKKLSIDINTFSRPLDIERIIFVEVQLANAGKGKLQAKRIGPDEYVYKDDFEQLRYSCSLQVKRVNTKKLTGETYLD